MQSDPWVNLKLAASCWQDRHDAAEHWRTVRDLNPPPPWPSRLAALTTGARTALRIGGATAIALFGGATSQAHERVARQHRELDLN